MALAVSGWPLVPMCCLFSTVLVLSPWWLTVSTVVCYFHFGALSEGVEGYWNAYIENFLNN